jgi:hypothetical protein
MKKFILFFMFAFLSIKSFSNHSVAVVDTSQTPVLDKTEKLVDKYGAKIADAFMSSIDKATPFVKSTFTSLVYLQIGRGVAYLMPLILSIIFFLIFLNEYKKIDNILKSDKVPNNLESRYGVFHENNINPPIIISLVLFILLFIVGCFTYKEGLEHIFAPQWFAVKDTIELFK